MNLRITYIIISCLLSSYLFAQISETEPNDGCFDTGIKTISTFGSFTGDLGGHSGIDPQDYWKLQAGSSGMIQFDLFLSFGTAYYDVKCYTEANCGGNLVNATPVDGVAPVTITLNPSYYYVIVIYEQDMDGTEYEIIISSLGGVLPVELKSFSAMLDENQVSLNWETATEVNNYGFEIERQYSDASASLSMTVIPSLDEGWENIGFVEGHGNSNSPKYYSFYDKSIEASGKYFYRLKQVDIDGTFEYSEEVDINLGAPNNYELAQNYPNPFNPSSSISYSIPNDGLVTLGIYDVLGNQVLLLENGYKSAGNYTNSFDGTNLTSGIYFYTLKSGNFTKTRKMILLK